MTNTKMVLIRAWYRKHALAMDRFKMEAAADLGVYSPQKRGDF